MMYTAVQEVTAKNEAADQEWRFHKNSSVFNRIFDSLAVAPVVREKAAAHPQKLGVTFFGSAVTFYDTVRFPK